MLLHYRRQGTPETALCLARGMRRGTRNTVPCNLQVSIELLVSKGVTRAGLRVVHDSQARVCCGQHGGLLRKAAGAAHDEDRGACRRPTRVLT